MGPVTYECATKVLEDMLEEGATLRDMLKESGQSADGAVVCKLDNDPTLFGYILRYLQGDCGKDFLEHLSVAGLKRLRSESMLFQLSGLTSMTNAKIRKMEEDTVKETEWYVRAPAGLKPRNEVTFSTAVVGDRVVRAKKYGEHPFASQIRMGTIGTIMGKGKPWGRCGGEAWVKPPNKCSSARACVCFSNHETRKPLNFVL